MRTGALVQHRVEQHEHKVSVLTLQLYPSIATELQQTLKNSKASFLARESLSLRPFDDFCHAELLIASSVAASCLLVR